MFTFLNLYSICPQPQWQGGRPALFSLLVAGLLWACSSGSSADLQHQQAANLSLAKTLHKHLNQRDWNAVSNLCADRVRYRGRTTKFADVDEPRAQFLTHYRATLQTDQQGTFELRQLYPAGEHHIIAEGIVTTDSLAAPMPACLIYTIEDDHITRLYAY